MREARLVRTFKIYAIREFDFLPPPPTRIYEYIYVYIGTASFQIGNYAFTELTIGAAAYFAYSY